MLIEKVRATIERFEMLKPRERVLAAVSGGPDSTALLILLSELRGVLRLSLAAAYVNHGLRPSAAKREERFVRSLGKRLGIPVTVLRRRVKKQPGISPEETARRARYEALTALARRTRCRVIAVGHTLDDQAETVLMWLLRGTGTTGLMGIPPVRSVNGQNNGHSRGLRIIRPMISSTKKEIANFLKERKIRPREDRSNRSTRFFRNRVRRELIPFLERRYSGSLRYHLAQLADIVREDFGWLQEEAARQFKRSARVGSGAVHFDRRALLSVPAGLRMGILRHGVARLQGDRSGFRHRHWVSLNHLADGKRKGPLDLPHRFRAEIDPKGRLVLRRE
ncbi:MAG: tRNA lysidine(34) synthetase TilS [Candidatus Omnitrophica bacterium]|nr:tRNA lysidine(34) synthetase TilS [Candidatus Omnitrophota bacterium]